jgi:hypothetical protein
VQPPGDQARLITSAVAAQADFDPVLSFVRAGPEALPNQRTMLAKALAVR